MKIRIIVPSYKRPRKLLDCLASLDRACALVEPHHDIKIHVYYSDELEYSDSHMINGHIYMINKETPSPILIEHYLLKEPYKASTFWNNRFNEIEADLYVYLNDDVVVDIFCIYNAVRTFIAQFPDLDGVVGLFQSNIPEDQVCQTAFGIIGNAFINRFKNRKVFCEQYYAFYLDKELEECSKHLNKFYWDKEAKLFHRHPAFSKDLKDECHTHNRINLSNDKIKYMERKENNLLWGVTDGKI